jgi:hypothetical protein
VNLYLHVYAQMVCKVDTRGILVQARTTLRPVGSAAARVALHRSARSKGYKLSREGTDPRSSRGMCVWCVFRLVVVPKNPPL